MPKINLLNPISNNYYTSNLGKVYQFNTPFKLEITANKGRRFKGDEFTFSYGVQNSYRYPYTFTLTANSDKTKLTFEFFDNKTDYDITPKVFPFDCLFPTYDTELLPKELDTLHTSNYATLLNCSTNVVRGESVVNLPYTVEIVASEGYTFKGTFFVNISESGFGGVAVELNNEGDKLTTTIDVAKLKQLLGAGIQRAHLSVSRTYEATNDIKIVDNFSKVFAVTQDDLKNLSKKRFYGSSGELDLFQYIFNIYRVPFNPFTFAPVKNNIFLNEVDTDISCDFMTNNIQEIDLGSIKIPSKYNNSFDYINTQFYVDIPYFGLIFFNETNYFIDKEISAILTFDCYDNSLYLELRSDGLPFYNGKSSFGTKIPYIYRDENLRDYAGNFTRTNKMRITLIRNTPVNIDFEDGNKDIDEGLVSNFEGFTQGYLLDNICDFTDEEEILKSVFAEGVYL